MPPRKRKQLEVDSARGGGIEAENHAAAKRVAPARVQLIDVPGLGCDRLDRVGAWLLYTSQASYQ